MKRLKRLVYAIPIAALLTGCEGYSTYNDASISARYGGTIPANTGILQAQLDTCDTEIARLQRRLETMENLLSNIQGDVAQIATGEGVSTTAQQEQIDQIDAALKKVQADLTALTEHGNETAKALSKSLSEINQLGLVNNQSVDNIKNLEIAMRSLMTAVQHKGHNKDIAALDSSSVSLYKVKSGDSLGKIAHENNTSIETLLELNNLKRNDLIIIGQEIKLPQ